MTSKYKMTYFLIFINRFWVKIFLLISLIISVYLIYDILLFETITSAVKNVTIISKHFDEEHINNDERDILQDTKTSYLPSKIAVPAISKKGKRQTQPFNPYEYRDKSFNYDAIVLRNKTSVDLVEAASNFPLNWEVLDPDEPVNVELDFEVDERDNLLVNETSEIDNEIGLRLWDAKMSLEEVRQIQADAMLKYIDESVHPCTDFFIYACGNWAKYNPIPPERVGFDTFEQLRERLDSVLRDLLEEKIDDEKANTDKELEEPVNENRDTITIDVKYEEKINFTSYTTADAIVKAKYLYKSCMNEDILNRRAEKPLLDLLSKLGGWPVIDPEWDSRNFDFIGLLSQLRLYNNDILISEWIGPDIKNSKEYVVQIDQTTLGLPTADCFLDQANLKYVEAYRIYIIHIASLLGAPILDATEDADGIIEFETNLAMITAPPDFRRNVSEIYNRLTLGELHALIPQINWYRYMTTILEKPIDMSLPIVVYCIPFLKNLVTLLSVTPSRIIANYILWRFVRHRANNLDKRFDDAKQRFYSVILGREKTPPRWQSCVSQVNSNLGMALGSMFVNRYFDETSKNDTLLMTIDLQQSFREILYQTDWLDVDTKNLAIGKINAMRLKIGYPDFILKNEELTKRYHDIDIHPDYYFENILSILTHLTRVEQARIGLGVNKDLWNTAPAVVNAYYSRNKNQIMFPAGILQPPFYHRNFPKALNYGGIGVVIGHEITHGFDDKGRLFDQEGNLQRWWKDSSIEQFHQHSQCLIDQYNGYVVPEINEPVDGTNTQGENIADNGGIKQAFRAYRRWQQLHPYVDDFLPGLNMTSEQLFFLNFAQVWCGTIRPEAAKNKLKTAVHSPGRFRVIGTLSNSEDFAKAFNCPINSPMNPKEKCCIW